MTLLIVDDEWYAVKGISQGIDWAQAGIDTVLEAFSGEKAKAILDRQSVDVLICDIEMPDISGLELSRWCTQRHPAVKIIFLTGHASFPYANEALRLKAFDYVLKPVDHARLMGIVKSALRKAQEEGAMESDAERWKEYSAQLEAQRPERTRLFWRNVIDNRLGRESIRAWLSLQEIDLDAPGLVTPVAVWTDDGGGTMRDEDIVAFVLDERLDEVVLTRFAGCRLKDPELDTLLLLYGNPPANLQDRLGKLLRSLEGELHRSLNWQIGDAAAPEALWWAVRRLRAGLARTAPGGEASAAEDFDWACALLTLPKDQLHARLDQTFAELSAQNRPLRLYAERLRFKGAALSLADRFGFSKDAVCVLQALPDSPEFSPASLRWVHQAIDLCLEEINICPISDNALIALTRQYIRTHLAQDLTRETIAAHVYLHPSYLSRLFKHEMGVTLSDYITAERVQAACRLLESPAIKIGAVAAQVGYPQFSYFCRVFRRVTGMSPQEYRQKVTGREE
jgi:two-component system response regulator YesN